MQRDRFARSACGTAALALASCTCIQAQERTRSAADTPAHTQRAAPAERSEVATPARNGAARPDGGVPMARADRLFIERATMGALADVELGRLAQIRASREEVRQFGMRMVEDHSRAAVELRQLAQIKGIGVPAAPDALHAREIQRLGKLSGPQFDRQYMAHMLSDHRKDVLEFKRASTAAKDSDVRAFAGKALLTLEEHLKLAESVSESVQSAR
jgi:putative membrane protein